MKIRDAEAAPHIIRDHVERFSKKMQEKTKGQDKA